MSMSRWVSAVFAALLAAGPLGPMTAVAQTSATEPLQPMQSMQPERVDDSVVAPPGTGAKIGAGVLNVVYLPGKAIICSAGTLVAGAFMLATFGRAYREATSFFNEGCRGAWLLTPEQVAAVPESYTGQYLKQVMDRRRGAKAAKPAAAAE
jgi:hypothetical protein